MRIAALALSLIFIPAIVLLMGPWTEPAAALVSGTRWSGESASPGEPGRSGTSAERDPAASRGYGRKADRKDPFVIVLGIAQDGGVPQAGAKDDRGWDDPLYARKVVSLGIVDPLTSQRWMIDATPDFREQLHILDEVLPVRGTPGLDGIFLSHAHIGHYTGLMFLGREAIGASEVPVYAMPRMGVFLAHNGPWDQLVSIGNILLKPLADGNAVAINDRLTVTPFLVPHRQEYSDVAGFVIKGPNRSVLYVTDIDKWELWDKMGTRVEDMVAGVDVAYLDGTFFATGEIPGRDMSTFPHPFIADSMDRFRGLPAEERAKIRFIHLNHTNPALWADSSARRVIENRGFHVAEELERVEL
jgi:pyrroloquinoline quinone biosynthesis protein B